MDSTTSNGYSISPSTRPGVSSRSTHAKFLLLLVEISVKTFSVMPLNCLQALPVVKRERRRPFQGLALATAGDVGEPAGLDRHARGLHGLADVPVDERRLASAVVADDHHVHLLARLVHIGQAKQGIRRRSRVCPPSDPSVPGARGPARTGRGCVEDALGAGHPERVIVGRSEELSWRCPSIVVVGAIAYAPRAAAASASSPRTAKPSRRSCPVARGPLETSERSRRRWREDDDVDGRDARPPLARGSGRRPTARGTARPKAPGTPPRRRPCPWWQTRAFLR